MGSALRETRHADTQIGELVNCEAVEVASSMTELRLVPSSAPAAKNSSSSGKQRSGTNGQETYQVVYVRPA